MPGREAEFESKAGAFEHQANQVANTAIQLANAGGNTNKRLLDQIRQNAEEVSITENPLSACCRHQTDKLCNMMQHCLQ